MQLQTLGSRADHQQAANSQLVCQVYSMQVEHTEQEAAACRHLKAAAALSAENAKLQAKAGKAPFSHAASGLIKAAHVPPQGVAAGPSERSANGSPGSQVLRYRVMPSAVAVVCPNRSQGQHQWRTQACST